MKKAASLSVLLKVSIIFSVFLTGMLAISGVFTTEFSKVEASSSFPSIGVTGAPEELTCNICHATYPVNSGTGEMIISGIPANYLPNQQIPVTVTINDSTGLIFGFQFTAIDKDGASAGTLIIPGGEPSEISIQSGTINGFPRSYIQHNSAGTSPTAPGTREWNFIWQAPETRVGKISFYASGNAGNFNGSPGGDRIYTTSASTLSGSAVSNFDNDGISDLAVFRPIDSNWYTITSGGSYIQTHFGEPGDIAVSGDYDGDGITDLAVWRPSNGTWYIKLSTGDYLVRHFGETGDIPVSGDFDGDLMTDIAIWRPSTGMWYILQSTTASMVTRHWGVVGDIPVQADFDGDGVTDLAIWRPTTGTWYVIQSRTSDIVTFDFGMLADVPVQADYDGDGLADYAVFRPSTGMWYILTASSYLTYNFGIAGDIPAPADYDGDGKADLTMFRNGTWYILGSDGPTFTSRTFGEAGDIPIASFLMP